MTEPTRPARDDDYTPEAMDRDADAEIREEQEPDGTPPPPTEAPRVTMP